MWKVLFEMCVRRQVLAANWRKREGDGKAGWGCCRRVKVGNWGFGGGKNGTEVFGFLVCGKKWVFGGGCLWA